MEAPVIFLSLRYVWDPGQIYTWPIRSYGCSVTETTGTSVHTIPSLPCTHVYILRTIIGRKSGKCFSIFSANFFQLSTLLDRRPSHSCHDFLACSTRLLIDDNFQLYHNSYIAYAASHTVSATGSQWASVDYLRHYRHIDRIQRLRRLIMVQRLTTQFPRRLLLVGVTIMFYG